MKNKYLLPILAFFPIMVIIFMLSRLEYDMTPQIIGGLVVTYVTINIIYSVAKGTFHVSILVELTLISLIAFFVLMNLT